MKRSDDAGGARVGVDSAHFDPSEPLAFIEDITADGVAALEYRWGTRARWVWASNPLTSLRRQPSALASLETVVAVVAMLLVAAKLENGLGVMAAMALMAPFGLLRTNVSMTLGLRWAKRFAFTGACLVWLLLLGLAWWFARDLVAVLGAIVFGIFPAMFCAPGLVGAVIRVMATIRSTVTRPVESLQAIPANWFRGVFCTDSFHPPEAVPGIEVATASGCYDPELAWRWNDISETEELGPLMTAAFVAAFVPSLCFRMALKGTAIIWLPLLWAVIPTRESWRDDAQREQSPERSKLREVRYGAEFVVVRALSLLIGMVVVGRIALPLLMADARISLLQHTREWPAEGLLDVLSRMLDLDSSVKLWHLASLVNAVLAWWLWYWADKRLRWDDREPHQVERFIRLSLFARRCLTVFVLINSLGILIAAADMLGGIGVSLKIFNLEQFRGF